MLRHDSLESIQRERAAQKAAGHSGGLPPTRFLAISGGGEDGAFGAGLLVGWTANGTRPEFKLVTGVSTGALIAPFAFLGPRYDDALKWIYTEVTVKDILKPRGLLAALLDDALSDTTPLKRTVSKFMTAEMMQNIAAEHGKGRLLLIGTTNLDGRRGVIWNIGKIAASGHPRALGLIQDVIDGDVDQHRREHAGHGGGRDNGQRYQEMHVDGGASAQVFTYPPLFDLEREAKVHIMARQRQVYIIRNARLDAEWEQVDRSMLSIAGRSISALIQNQGIGDLYRIYVTSLRDKVDFNLVYIPETFRTAEEAPRHQLHERALQGRLRPWPEGRSLGEGSTRPRDNGSGRRTVRGRAADRRSGAGLVAGFPFRCAAVGPRPLLGGEAARGRRLLSSDVAERAGVPWREFTCHYLQTCSLRSSSPYSRA